jgi:hypothetical protein
MLKIICTTLNCKQLIEIFLHQNLTTARVANRSKSAVAISLTGTDRQSLCDQNRFDAPIFLRMVAMQPVLRMSHTSEN